MNNIEYYEMINQNLVHAMNPIAGMRVLEVGCATGKLGEHMKKLGAAYYAGIEAVETVAELARPRLDRVLVGDVEKMQLPLDKDSFDYLVFGDVLEHLADPWGVLRKCSSLLKTTGQVVASIPNINHASIFVNLLGGRWQYTDAGLLDRTHLRFFTLEEIINLFSSAGLTFSDATSCILVNPALEALTQDLDAVRRKYNLGSDRFAAEGRTYQWLIKARRS